MTSTLGGLGLFLLTLLSLLSIIRAAPKFDKSKYLKVSLKKPLGLNLEEVTENKADGVMIADVNDGGNAKASGAPLRGRFLCTVNNNDVRYSSFDQILDIIGGIPADETVNLEVVYPDDVFKGPAELEVMTAEGKSVTIKTLKGMMLRDALTSSGIDVYTNTAKMTNCGGAGQCGTCVVDVFDDLDWEPRSELEAKRLKKYPKSCRLSCNTVVEGDCSVRIRPPKLE